jgi:hypothetical protein
MGEYATESPASLRRRQQRRRALITIGTILLGLFFAFWYALSYYESDATTGQAAPAAPTCRTADPDEVNPDEVTILVLNATNRNGLAAKTAQSLGARDFVIAGAENDDSDRDPPKVAEIRHGPDGEAQAALVATVMPDGTELYDDEREGADVDVVLGEDFTELKDPVTPTTTPLPICPTPSES